jgi:hypothetical protein
MKPSYEDVKDKPVVLKAMTSLTRDEFEDLYHVFGDVLSDSEPPKDPTKGGRKPILKNNREKLFFILFYLKNYPLQEVIAYLFEMSQSRANEWIHILTPLLYKALERAHYLPQRIPAELLKLLTQEGEQELAIDGTERPINRPKEAQDQKAYYSGKKKRHTIKNDLVVGLNDRTVKYLSKTCYGKTHDKEIADEAQLRYPAATPLYQDKGFQGYAPEGVIIHQPKKKPRGGELTQEEKEKNRLISQLRVIVEHVISGIKRIKIVSEVFRNTKDAYDDVVMSIACGLHNLRTDHRLLSY